MVGEHKGLFSIIYVENGQIIYKELDVLSFIPRFGVKKIYSIRNLSGTIPLKEGRVYHFFNKDISEASKEAYLGYYLLKKR